MANFLISFIGSHPLISIISFSFLITFFSTWLYKKLTNQERVKELKKRQKELQAKLKLEKDPKVMLEVQNETLNISTEMMKISMKPTMISLLPIIIIFAIMGWLFNTAGVGNIMPWNFHIWGLCDWRLTKGICNGAGWLLSYIIFSLIFSPILRKIMKVE